MFLRNLFFLVLRQKYSDMILVFVSLSLSLSLLFFKDKMFLLITVTSLVVIPTAIVIFVTLSQFENSHLVQKYFIYLKTLSGFRHIYFSFISKTQQINSHYLKYFAHHFICWWLRIFKQFYICVSPKDSDVKIF